jgi:CheY-like chemotaxis protein
MLLIFIKMKPVIYIIEDSNIIRKQLIKYVEELSPDVYEFDCSQKALDSIRTTKPDLILLDLHLPDFNGDEFMVKLSEQLLIGDLKCILITANEFTPKDELRFGTLGISKCLKKPVIKDELISEIKILIES